MESVQVTEAMKSLRNAIQAELEAGLPTSEHAITVGGIVVDISICPGSNSLNIRVKKWESHLLHAKRGARICLKLGELPIIPVGDESPMLEFRDFDKDKAASRLGEEIIG